MILDPLGTVSTARCLVEYSLRVTRRAARSSIPTSGFDGLVNTSDGRLRAVPTREVLRLRSRVVPQQRETDVSRHFASASAGGTLMCPFSLLRKGAPEDPARAASHFNLSLTDRQREARESTVLPYARRGELVCDFGSDAGRADRPPL